MVFLLVELTLANLLMGIDTQYISKMSNLFTFMNNTWKGRGEAWKEQTVFYYLVTEGYIDLLSNTWYMLILP